MQSSIGYCKAIKNDWIKNCKRLHCASLYQIEPWRLPAYEYIYQHTNMRGAMFILLSGSVDRFGNSRSLLQTISIFQATYTSCHMQGAHTKFNISLSGANATAEV